MLIVRGFKPAINVTPLTLLLLAVNKTEFSLGMFGPLACSID